MITIANANALHIPLADRSVQCVVTSPPYFGLRDYGTAKWEGGSAECKHSVGGQVNMTKDKGTNRDGIYSTGMRPGADAYTCRICGARRIDAQIGLEATPAAYVANIVAVMRECWRVLKDDGTAWLNLGDSYAMSSMHGNGSIKNFTRGESSTEEVKAWKNGIDRSFNSVKASGLKPKDLLGIPWRVAFALQDDGWYLRQDIIWHKPNPMPESVTDRCTKAHEYVFLLTKQARYFYDADAIREPISESTIERWNGIPTRKNASPQGLNAGSVTGESVMGVNPSGRNRRSVWTVATSPYSGAHFATFPPALIEPMILAGTSQRGECPHCGKAWVRVVEKPDMSQRPTRKEAKHDGQRLSTGFDGYPQSAGQEYQDWRNENPDITTGWRQQCDCPPHDPIPQTVLDPFAGSGTTGAVAVKHGRRAVLLDLNTKYIDLQFERTNGVQMTMPV